MKMVKNIAIVSIIGIASIIQVNAQNNIKTAKEEIKKEQYNAAINQLKSVQTAESQFYIGDAYIHLLDYDSAKTAFNKGISLDKKFPLNYVGLAHIDLKKNDTSNANANITAALSKLKARVKDPSTYIEIMKSYEDAGKYNEAINYGEKALKITQSNPDLYVTLGDLYAESNTSNLSQAVEYYNDALKINPKDANAYTRLAVAWSRNQNKANAMKYFNDAIAANPKYAPAYRELAIYYYRINELDSAIVVYKNHYLPLVGNNCEAETQYIQFVFLAGDSKTAIQEIDKLKQEKGCDNLLEMGRMEGYAAYETGKYQQSEQALLDFLKKAPKAKVIAADYVYLGKAEIKLSKQDSTKKELGIKDLYKSLQFADSTDKMSYMKLYSDLAKTFFDNNMFPQAADMYQQKIKKFAPYNGEAVDLRDMGRAYAFAGDYKQADKAFAKLLQQDSTYVFGYFMRAQVNAQKGMSQDSAMKFYQKVIDLSKSDPKNNESYLAQSYKFMGNYYFNQNSNSVSNIDKTLSYYNKWYQLDPAKYANVKQAIDAIQKRKAYIINRNKIIEERKKAGAK